MASGSFATLGESSRAVKLFLLSRMALGIALVSSVPLLKDLPVRMPIFEPSTLLVTALASFAVWTIALPLATWLGHRPIFLWSQMLLDALLATALVQLTEGPRSALFVLYVANLSAAGVLISPNAALFVCGLDTALFLGGSLWVAMTMPDRLWKLSSFELSYELVLRCFALLLIGILVRLLTERVRQVKAEQSVVLDEVSVGVLRVSPRGVVRSVNPAAQRLLGAREGDRLRTLLTPVDDRWEQVVRVDDEPRHLLCSVSPLETGDQLVLVDDITQIKKMEADLEREERLAGVGRLTAALAHEIRNPLTSLSGAVQLLAEERPDPLHDIVLREVRRINGLVEELLDQARPLALQPIPTDPGAILNDAVSALRLDPRFRDRIDVQIQTTELGTVPLDPGRFKQVLWNLMLNAAQAIPERGRVTIRATMDGEDLVLDVQDTGVGIPAGAQRRVFDPFFTTRVGGTGLGLATVHRIVTAHGGRIGISSLEGEGTTFHLRFPAGEPREGRLVG